MVNFEKQKVTLNPKLTESYFNNQMKLALHQENTGNSRHEPLDQRGADPTAGWGAGGELPCWLVRSHGVKKALESHPF